MKLDKKEILEYQQNRSPYLMIDFVDEVIPGKSATVDNVKASYRFPPRFVIEVPIDPVSCEMDVAAAAAAMAAPLGALPGAPLSAPAGAGVGAAPPAGLAWRCSAQDPAN